MNRTHYRKLERMYLAANINRSLFPSTGIHISDGRAEITLDISDQYFHALKAVHGSVYFKLLDDSAFFAASSQVMDFFILTTSFEIKLIRPVAAGKLTAIGTLKMVDTNFLLAESVLKNEAGKEIAFGSGKFVISKSVLTEQIGYY